MSVERVNTEGLTIAQQEFQTAIQTFTGFIQEVRSKSDELLDSWEGKGKAKYSAVYIMLYSRLTDVSDELYDMYNTLVETETAYIDADEEIAKQLTISNSSSSSTSTSGSGGGGGGAMSGR